MSGDRITLTGVRAYGRHGVYDHERAEGQEFVVDLVLHLPLKAAARLDDVARTVHYGELAERVVALVEGDPVDLIEALASRIADAVLEDAAVQRVEVTVHKPSAPITVPFADVSVTLVRGHEHRAVLALGSNLGDRSGRLASAVAAIAGIADVSLLAQSPAVESAAVTLAGVDESRPAYLNQIVIVRTSRHPIELLDALQQVETVNGRVRAERWADRTLDIDIVDFDGLEQSFDRLELPHPRAAERAFVLVPWALVDPEAQLRGIPVHRLAERVRDEVSVIDR